MYNADNVISLETFKENTVSARWIQIFDLETTQDELEAHCLNVENSSPFTFQHMLLYAHDSVFPSRSRLPVGQSKQVLRTYFP